jgi:bifunctional DNA-binding transcriptional regulator/antitoxin component of YhaV-PrlF toxin-antitoxin module
MTLLTITAKGQVTLKKDLLEHLGVRSGQKIEVEPLPDGQAIIRSARRTYDISALFGILKSKNKKNLHLTIEEIDDAAAKGWMGKL